MASAFTSIFYHKGYSGIRYREVYKMVEDEIQLIKTEEGVERKRLQLLEEAKIEARKIARSESMKKYWRQKKGI